MPIEVADRSKMNLNQIKKLQDFLNSSVISWIGLAVAIFALAALVNVIRSWYRDDDDPADSTDEILDQMRELKRQGDLTDEEYRSIESRVTGGVGESTDD